MSRRTPSVLIAVLVAASLILLPAGRADAQPSAPGNDIVTPLPSSHPPPASAPPMVPAQPAPPLEVDPGLPPPPPNPPLYRRHWFYAALGLISLSTVLIVYASARSTTPITTLGNMRAN